MPTRWNQWYSAENLEKDPRILAAKPTRSAQMAAVVFRSRRLSRILDLGCGVGRDTFYLLQSGLHVLGADAATNGMRVARRRGAAYGLPADFLTADARRLPFPEEALDGVYCFGMIHEFTGPVWQVDLQSMMTEIRRVLIPGGVFILTAAAGTPDAGLPHVRLFSREMFEKAVRGFQTVELENFDDVGCTGRDDYRVWFAVLEKKSGAL